MDCSLSAPFAKSGALQYIRVLDVTRLLPGATCTLLLAGDLVAHFF
jgi:crotonobetainyl-CoA:carnitine CoA-transferase CaiB-like acyl-CoA transferase